MNYLFTHAPYIVPGSKRTEYVSHDLENRVDELEHKQASTSHAEVEHKDE